MKHPIAPRRAVLRLDAYHGIQEDRAGKLRLDFNENTVGCAPVALRAVARMTRAQVAMYPEYTKTRAMLARNYGVRPDELLLTNGADDALRLVFDTFVDRGNIILLAEPTFNMYRFWAALAGARAVTLRYDAEMRFPLAEALRALKRRPRALFLANPNNPTGTVVERGALRRLLGAAPHTLLVVDEAYSEFCAVGVLPWIRRFPNLVVVRTLSKAAGLAGLRLGLVFTNRDTARAMRTAQAPFAVNTAALVAAAASAADRSFIKRYVVEVKKSKRHLEGALLRLGVKAFPSGGNFLLADFGARGPKMVAALRRRGILLRDRTHDFGRPGLVRITIGTRPQMRRLVRALNRELRG